MKALKIDKNGTIFDTAVTLRKLFSGIVAGNVKEPGIRRIEQYGPYQLTGDPSIISHLDRLLRAFAEQGRMKLSKQTYQPCYTLNQG